MCDCAPVRSRSSMPMSIGLAAACQSSVSCAIGKSSQNRVFLAQWPDGFIIGQRERALDPVDAFAKLAFDRPGHVERRNELQSPARVDCEERLERDAQVLSDATEHLEVRPLRSTHGPHGSLKGNALIEARVSLEHPIQLGGGAELLDSVLAQRGVSRS